MDSGSNGVGCGELGEPLVYVLLDNVVDNRDPVLPRSGCEVLPENGYANGCVSGTDVS